MKKRYLYSEESQGQRKDLNVTMIEEGRRIDFKKDYEDFAQVFRKVNNGSWICIAKGIESPYFDQDDINSPSTIEYYVQVLGQDGSEKLAEDFQVRI